MLMVGAGLCWSTGGILIRSVTLTDAWEIVFWRALFMALFMGVVLTGWHGAQVVKHMVAVGFPGPTERKPEVRHGYYSH